MTVATENFGRQPCRQTHHQRFNTSFEFRRYGRHHLCQMDRHSVITVFGQTNTKVSNLDMNNQPIDFRGIESQGTRLPTKVKLRYFRNPPLGLPKSLPKQKPTHGSLSKQSPGNRSQHKNLPSLQGPESGHGEDDTGPGGASFVFFLFFFGVEQFLRCSLR